VRGSKLSEVCLCFLCLRFVGKWCGWGPGCVRLCAEGGRGEQVRTRLRPCSPVHLPTLAAAFH
jgi:hypothetical protein